MKPFPFHFRKPALRLVFVTFAAAAAGCTSSVDVRHQSALAVDSNAFASFEIVDHAVGRSESVDELIEHTLHHGMVAKGYARAPAGEADLLVSYKILLSGNDGSKDAPSSPPDDGLNGEAASMSSQPVWDVVAYNDSAGPQRSEKRATWSTPGAQPVFDTIPAIDVSSLSRQLQDKTLIVMLQEPKTYRVLWVGWSSAEVTPENLAAATEAALGEIVSKIPRSSSAS